MVGRDCPIEEVAKEIGDDEGQYIRGEGFPKQGGVFSLSGVPRKTPDPYGHEEGQWGNQ